MFCIAALAFAASLPVIDCIRIEARWGGLGRSYVGTGSGDGVVYKPGADVIR